MSNIFTIEVLSALATLVFLEIILGIDNVIFISITANKLPGESRTNAWRMGLILALILRVFMLFTLSWIMGFTKPLFNINGFEVSIRNMILLSGGLFLVYKSTVEISHGVGQEVKMNKAEPHTSVGSVIAQIIFIDFIFSFDSILTAIGLSNTVYIMVAAVIISMLIMMLFLGAIGEFIKNNPTIEILALAFLILIGFILILEAFHYNIPKGYIYFAVAFSLVTELLNIRKRKVRKASPANTEPG